jgi:hypothetical protein
VFNEVDMLIFRRYFGNEGNKGLNSDQNSRQMPHRKVLRSNIRDTLQKETTLLEWEKGGTFCFERLS